jgi:hypothetical protein
MSTSSARNPFSQDGAPNYFGVEPVSVPDPAHYAESPNGNTQYIKALGWAPTLDARIGDTPDPYREELLPRQDRRANLRNFFGWWKQYDADTAKRESVVAQQTTGATEKKGRKDRAPDARWAVIPETRPTLNPHTYFFQRPFGKDVANRLTGDHFSLADNRRAYDILTQTPIPQRRTTYRLEPSPWDANMYDSLPDSGYVSANRAPAANVPLAASQRSYRL